MTDQGETGMNQSGERSGERAWEMLQLSVAKYRPLKAPEEPQLVAAAPSAERTTATRPDSVWRHDTVAERRRAG
jgi:hypothetical protein